MKNIMILGASILQLPAIIKAKEMGLLVIAVDMDEKAIGFKYADICENISTIDIEKVTECAKKHRIDAIITLASDMPMRTIAAVSEKLKIIGITKECALKATNKFEMRKALKENNVAIPEFYSTDNFEEYKDIIERFKGKFIVKPVDNSGSRGIFLVRNHDEAENAFKYSKQYSRNGFVMVEEFMQGKEVSVESLTINSETHIIQITDKITTGAPNFVEMGHTQPTSLSADIVEKIKMLTKDTVKAIGITNGPSHTEIIVEDGNPKVVEIGARLGGDNITSHLVPMSTGVNMIESIIKIALGEPVDVEKKYDKASAIRYFYTECGHIKNIKNIETARKINGVQEIFFTKKIGDKIETVQNSNDRTGYVITRADTNEEAAKICNSVLNLIEFEVEL